MRKIYKKEDLTRDELDLLARASMLPEGSFLCFGKAYHKLRALDLVDSEYVLTYDGKHLAKAWMKYQGE